MPRTARTAILVLIAVAVPAGTAVSAPRDRDRDRWERRYDVKRPGADADRDGLANRAEYRNRTHPRRRDTDRDRLRDADELRFGWHPRRRDTDRDGTRDGREKAGVVKSVDGLRVTIALAVGRRLTAVLEDPDVIGCAPLPSVSDAGGPNGPAGESDDGAEDDLTAEDLAEFWDPSWGDLPSDLDDESDEDAGPALEDMMPLARSAQVVEDEDDAEDEELTEDDYFTADEMVEETSGCQAKLRVGVLVHEATTTGAAGARRITSLRLVG